MFYYAKINVALFLAGKVILKSHSQNLFSRSCTPF